MVFVLYLLILTLASTIQFSNSSFKSSLNSKSSVNRLSKHRSNPNVLQNRIIGGEFVGAINTYPFMAFLYSKTENKINATHVYKKKGACGASIIGPSHAITAAHCVRYCHCKGSVDDSNCEFCKSLNVHDLTLFVGELTINKSPGLVNATIEKYYIHPNHKTVDVLHRCMQRFDIAVLKLATPLQFNDKISSIGLPKPVTLGWGYTSSKIATSGMKPALKVAKVSLLAMQICMNDFEKITKYEIANSMCTDTHLCSKSSHYKDGICKGDSGGPIICEGVLVGVTSVAFKGCVGPHMPNMYTRVDINVDWILGILSEK